MVPDDDTMGGAPLPPDPQADGLGLRSRAGQRRGEYLAESLVQVAVEGFELEYHDAELLSPKNRG